MLLTHEMAAMIAIALNLIGQSLYIFSIVKGRTVPHLFTWMIWGLLGGIGFMAQLHGGAGPGAWSLGIASVLCFVTALLALKWGERNITKGDKLALASAALALIPWLMTDNPLGSVIMISLINVAGFYPTIRKSWHKPGEEILTSYVITALVMVFSLLAMHQVNMVTALYPATVVAANALFLLMCLIRRKELEK